jgi:ketosteroid isomerase-like protein
MASNDPKAVADRFFTAWTSGDFDTARLLLHDDVSFSGPIDRWDNADAYVGALRGRAQIVKGAEEQKVLVDGNDVCVIYDLFTNTPAGTAPTAEWYHLRNGKISAVRVYFDARPFAAMFEGKG